MIRSDEIIPWELIPVLEGGGSIRKHSVREELFEFTPLRDCAGPGMGLEQSNNSRNTQLVLSISKKSCCGGGSMFKEVKARWPDTGFTLSFSTSGDLWCGVGGTRGRWWNSGARR